MTGLKLRCAYHSTMRRFLLILMISLLPLQSWALGLLGSGWHGPEPVASASVSADLPCHEQASESDHGGHASAQPDSVIHGSGPVCQDCQTCDLCHLTLSLLLPLSVFDQLEHHPLPLTGAAYRAGRHWPPPLEPPRI